MAISRAFGTTIQIGTTLVGFLTDINGIDKTADQIEVTTLDSSGRYREFIGGFKDGGEVTITGYFAPGNAGQTELEEKLEDGTQNAFTITYPAELGATWVFEGIVTRFSASSSLEDPVSFEATIKVVGKPELGTTPSTGLSALEITQAGGGGLTAFVITPAFAIGTFYYAATFTTETAYIVKPTGADHTIKLYVDGVFIEEIITGAESSSIAQAAAGAKEIKLVAFESGKTPKTYTIMVAKTA